MPNDLVYTCSEDVLQTKIDDEIVLMSLSGGFYHGMDPVGSQIRELISNAPMTLDALSEALVAEYDVDLSTCREDIEIFLQVLLDQDLVVQKTPAS